MQDPIVKHSYVQVNNSFVHLLQYGSPNEASILQSPSHQRRRNSPKENSSLSTTLTSKSSSSFGSSISSLKENSEATTNTTNSSDSPSTKKLVIFIPGNPGILGIYHSFLVSTYRIMSSYSDQNTQQLPTILAIGHNNFDHPDHVQYRAEERICLDEKDLNFVEREIAKNHENDPHNIELQVLNKLIILKRLLKINIEDCKIVFVGHSIGCYIILRLLQDKKIALSHEGSILIHPALENLALTEKGLRFDRLFSYRLDLVAESIAFVLDNLLPRVVKTNLIKWFCSAEFVENSSSIALDSIAQLVCHRTFKALIQMAKSELSQIKNINVESMIKPHTTKLKLIYAINDGWVNTDNRRILADLYPNLYMEEQPTLHAFVMEPQTVMDYAMKSAMFIQDFFDNTNSGDSGL